MATGYFRGCVNTMLMDRASAVRLNVNIIRWALVPQGAVTAGVLADASVVDWGTLITAAPSISLPVASHTTPAMANKDFGTIAYTFDNTADVTFPLATADTAKDLVMFEAASGTGAPVNTDKVILAVDLAATPTGGNIDLQFSGSGICKLGGSSGGANGIGWFEDYCIKLLQDPQQLAFNWDDDTVAGVLWDTTRRFSATDLENTGTYTTVASAISGKTHPALVASHYANLSTINYYTTTAEKITAVSPLSFTSAVDDGVDKDLLFCENSTGGTVPGGTDQLCGFISLTTPVPLTGETVTVNLNSESGGRGDLAKIGGANP